VAYPEAEILSFDHVPLQKVDWESLEHVKLTRDFLNNPDNYLRFI
jgi:predicted ATPase